MSFKEHLKNYATKELELIGFMESEFGNECLNFLDKCADISHNDTNTMKELCNLLIRLVDKKPLSPITEDDFEVETYTEGNKTLEISRCTRYPYIYKMNGKYYNDRAVAFRRIDDAESDRMYIYQTRNSSKQEITLPYFPNEEIKILQHEYQDLEKQDPEPDYEVE